MSNEKMLELLIEFKKFIWDTRKVSPSTYQICEEILGIFYVWFASQKEK